jgi:hypothetical protein
MLIVVTGVKLLRRDPPHLSSIDASSSASASPEIDRGDASGAQRTIVRPDQLSYEAFVITHADAPEVTRAAERVDELVAPRFCSADEVCQGAAVVARDPKRTALEPMTVERVILPPRETAGPALQTLTPPQVDALYKCTQAVHIRVAEPRTGRVGKEAEGALRAGLVLTAALAERLHGFVYDEVRHVVFDEAAAKDAALRLEANRTAFRPELVTIEIAPEGDSFRLLSRGMIRFGAPDLQLSGIAEADTSDASRLLNQLLAKIAEGERHSPVVLFPRADAGAGAAMPVSFQFDTAPLDEGHPDNDVLEVDAEDLPFTTALRLVVGVEDVAAKQRAAALRLPALLDAFRRTRGASLSLRVEFTFGPDVEAIWVSLRSCDLAADSCEGTLQNPPRSTHTTWKLGERVRFERSRVSGFVAGGTLKSEELR